MLLNLRFEPMIITQFSIGLVQVYLHASILQENICLLVEGFEVHLHC